MKPGEITAANIESTLTEGVLRIAGERARHLNVKRWSARHDDEHTDHSLALAACAYATPQPLYRVAAQQEDQFAFVDCWPRMWDSEYDKRIRDAVSRRLLLAGEMAVDRRIRQLEKAGALIAAEIDRLVRLQKKGVR